MKTFDTVEEARRYTAKYPDELVQVEEYYSTGGMSALCYCINGELHNDYREYFDDGVISGYWWYNTGKRYGECKSFHPSGALRVHSYYDVNMHGEFVEYNEDSILVSHCYYVFSTQCNTFSDAQKKLAEHNINISGVSDNKSYIVIS